jgi:hypothetical protein
MPGILPISKLAPDIGGLSNQTSMPTFGRTVSRVEKVKLQHHVPAGLVSALDSELRKGKDPTLPTLADGITYCLELGVAELAKKNKSEEGEYIANLFSTLRRMELEEKIKDAEFKTQGFVPRDFRIRPGNVRVIREEGGGQ